MKIKQNGQKRARIEMIPLIDVVFLLLIFFIYTMLSMVIHRGISVNLPRAKTAVVDKKDFISLTVTERGEIYMDETKTSLEEMELLLIREREKNPKMRIFLRGDRKAWYERIIQVLDVVRKVGFTRISFETEFEENEQSLNVNKK